MVATRTHAVTLLVLPLLACSTSAPPRDGSPGDTNTDATPADVYSRAPHPSFPQVAAPTGMILSPVRLITITAGRDPLAPQVEAFGAALGSSPWWTAVSQEYGLGPIAQSLSATGPALPTVVTHADLVQYVQNLIASIAVPVPDDSHIYLLYLPPATTLRLADGTMNYGCGYLRGYHGVLDAQHYDNIAVVQRCQPDPGETVLDIATQVASHEVAEAATDPDEIDGFVVPGDTTMVWNATAWADLSGGGSNTEVGDLCEGTLFRDGTYAYQRIWSNAAAMLEGDPCIPAVAASYFSVSAPQDWYTVSAGGSIDIPLTGWSTGDVPSWGLVAVPSGATTATMHFAWQIDASSTVTISPRTFPAANNSTTATLHVDATRAVSGEAILLRVLSLPVEVQNDEWHSWPVGVHVQ